MGVGNLNRRFPHHREKKMFGADTDHQTNKCFY